MSEPQQSTVDLRGAGATAVDGTSTPSATSTTTGTATTGGSSVATGDDAVARAEQASVGELVKEVAQDLSTLMRQEVALAKAEVKDEAKDAGKAAGMFGGAGFAGWMTALFLSLALMFLLGAVMPDALAALIVGVLWGIAGAVLFLQGRKTMKQVDPAPRETIETVKEDVQWARTRNG